jgi:hypothetical protein
MIGSNQWTGVRAVPLPSEMLTEYPPRRTCPEEPGLAYEKETVTPGLNSSMIAAIPSTVRTAPPVLAPL